MYYYIKYSITTHGRKNDTDCVADKHPFEWLRFFKTLSSDWALIDWKEITKEDYEKGKLIIGVG